MEHREAVEKVIDFLDLQHYRDSLIGGLAYGLRKMVEFGRALATEPAAAARRAVFRAQCGRDRRHWFLDPGNHEPLDITVLMVEHDMRLVSAVSDA